MFQPEIKEQGGASRRRVLKPPGGGSSGIFGSDPQEDTPRKVKDYQKSNIFGSGDETSQSQAPEKQPEKYRSSLFSDGDADPRPAAPKQDRMHSTIFDTDPVPLRTGKKQRPNSQNETAPPPAPPAEEESSVVATETVSYGTAENGEPAPPEEEGEVDPELKEDEDIPAVENLALENEGEESPAPSSTPEQKDKDELSDAQKYSQRNRGLRNPITWAANYDDSAPAPRRGGGKKHHTDSNANTRLW